LSSSMNYLLPLKVRDFDSSEFAEC
jgi:hypothetical protein